MTPEALMFFARKAITKERIVRRERPELLVLCREMEERHQQVLLTRQSRKLPAASVYVSL
jgi:hypothetical protein